MSISSLPSRMSSHCASFTPFLVDVAVNLTDCVYRGVDWRERRIHEDDLNHVLQRAAANNVRKVVITGTSLSQSIDAIKLCRHYRELHYQQQEQENHKSNVEVKEEAYYVPTHSSHFSKHNESSINHDVTQTTTKSSVNSDPSTRPCLPANMLYCTVGVHPAHCAEFTRPLHIDQIVHAESHNCNYSLVKPTPCTMEDVEKNTVNIEKRLEFLKELVMANRDVVIGIGEIGLDDAELEYCPTDVQEFFFREQLRAFAPLHLPFMFHSRECGMRLVTILQEEEEEKLSMRCVQSSHEMKPIEESNLHSEIKEHESEKHNVHQMKKSNSWHGLVHSFNGSVEEQEALLSMGLYLSINGSAFRDKIKAEQLICIPTDRLLFESDGPWCDIRPHDYGSAFVHTTFAMCKRNKFTVGKCVERRNEPCHVVQVMEEYIGAVRAAQVDSNADAKTDAKCSNSDKNNDNNNSSKENTKRTKETSVSELSADVTQMHMNENNNVDNKIGSSSECMTLDAILRNHKISVTEAKKAMTKTLYQNFCKLFKRYD